MAEGRIKWYNPFQEDDKVTFEVRETQRGKQAVNVRAVKAYK